MATRFSLPPAVYKIHVGADAAARYITDPAADNDKIELKVVAATSDQLVRCDVIRHH
jgi:uncharacterized 2Fe-2S/4Fe-4S cluster protein (DUF4445 family)